MTIIQGLDWWFCWYFEKKYENINTNDFNVLDELVNYKLHENN